jgi:hypothetical protein
MDHLNVEIEPDLVEALERVGRRQGVSLTVLVNLALREFLESMDDDFELDGVRDGMREDELDPRPGLAAKAREKVDAFYLALDLSDAGV